MHATPAELQKYRAQHEHETTKGLSWCVQVGSLYTEQAAGFLGSCLPQGLLLPGLPGAGSMRGPGAAALQRLTAEGLGWAPTVGNLSTLLCFALALALNAQLTQVKCLSLGSSYNGMHHDML